MARSAAKAQPRKSWLDTERPELAAIISRNVRAMKEMRDETERQRGIEDRISDAITRFFGSMRFVYFHALFFGLWIVCNLGLFPRIHPWDPYPFVMLAMIASVEAIFLSTFVLISQNRQAGMDERRDELDLQINLLTEHEVTRLISMIDAMLKHFKVQAPGLQDLEELKKEVPPEKVLGEIEKVEQKPDEKAS